MIQSQNLLITQDQALLTIRLNRPSVLNAMTDDLMRDLDAALAKAQSDSSVRAILITGEGRGFCAGADLATSALAPSEAQAGAPRSAAQAEAHSAEAKSAPHVADKLKLVFNPVIQRMRQMPSPLSPRLTV